MNSEVREFGQIQKAIVHCRLCPRLVRWREKVAKDKVRRFRQESYWGKPLPSFGHPSARLAIVGLAPAAHGANRTGRVFTGDSSGEWLYDALHRFGFANQRASVHRNDGLLLQDTIITCTVRCAPPQNKPNRDERENCRRFLRRELLLLKDTTVVVALGQVAFHAFLKAVRENGAVLNAPLPRFKHGGEWQLPSGTILISSYHPSQQNTRTGRLTRSMFYGVFRKARAALDGAASPSRKGGERDPL